MKGIGLYRKYDVRRVDGTDQPGGKHDGCDLFVLDLTHDEHARYAAWMYALSCQREFPELAADLIAKLTPYGVPEMPT